MLEQVKCIHNINFGYEATYLNSCYSEVDDDLLYKLGFKFDLDLDSIYEITTIKGNFKLNNLNKFLLNYDILNNILKEKNFEISTLYDNDISNDGGGHIHLSLSRVNKKGLNFKLVFMKNMYLFFIKNPWLNWLFNQPYDTYNANSMLIENNQYEQSDMRDLETLWYNIIKDNPLTNELSKCLPLLYREFYQTIEFRLFMMPRNNDELILHFNLAICIYNHIFTKTENYFKISYNTVNNYVNDMDFDCTLFKLNNTKDIYSLDTNWQEVFDKLPYKYVKSKIINCLLDINYPSDDLKLLFNLKEEFLKIRFEYKDLLK